MKLSKVAEILDAIVVCGEAHLDRDVRFGFASDLMSDVLTLSTDNMLLITGMSNLQTIRTAEMADIQQMLSCSRSMFRSIAILAEAGLQPIY